MNLVDLLLARQSESSEDRLERFKQAQKRKWWEDGLRLYQTRKRLGLTRAFVSRETRVNTNRLRRLEQGLPVRDAKIIYRSYEMVLEKTELERNSNE